jgi:hypothetical protein
VTVDPVRNQWKRFQCAKVTHCAEAAVVEVVVVTIITRHFGMNTTTTQTGVKSEDRLDVPVTVSRAR